LATDPDISFERRLGSTPITPGKHHRAGEVGADWRDHTISSNPLRVAVLVFDNDRD